MYMAVIFDKVVDAEIFQHRNWAYFFHQELDQIGYSVMHGVCRFRVIDHTCIAVLLQGKFSQLLTNVDVCPRTCENEGAALCTDHNQFRLRSSQTFHLLQKVNNYATSHRFTQLQLWEP